MNTNQNIMDIAGTCISEAEISEKYDIPQDDVMDILLDNNIERCPGCEWWVESYELVDDVGELCLCENCRT